MRWLGLTFLILALPVQAQVRPQPGQGDPRIQSVQYDPDQIVHLPVVTGFQLMVSLASGEQIATIAVGDSAAWQVTPGKRGDFFFVKNISATSATNMTVVTNARVYNFDLAPSDGYSSYSAYNVRFIYSSPSPAIANQIDEPAVEYRVSGAKEIRPTRVFQSGGQTIIEWDKDQALPATFALENGDEMLVNGEMRDGHFVVAGVPEKLVFRLDKLKAEAKRGALHKPHND